MTICTALTDYLAFKRRRIEVNFSGGDITSDAGLPLLRQVDRKLGLLKNIASVLTDSRNRERTNHSTVELLRQQVYEKIQGQKTTTTTIVVATTSP